MKGEKNTIHFETCPLKWNNDLNEKKFDGNAIVKELSTDTPCIIFENNISKQGNIDNIFITIILILCHHSEESENINNNVREENNFTLTENCVIKKIGLLFLIPTNMHITHDIT